MQRLRGKKKCLKNHWDLSLLRNLYSINSDIRHKANQEQEKFTPVGGWKAEAEPISILCVRREQRAWAHTE